jgi:hypothetical protein
MSETSLVKISNDHKEILQKLIKVSDLKTEKSYIENAIEFFLDTGLDPLDRVKKVSGELKKLRDLFVSFIREQEKNKLNPIINKVDDLTSTLILFLKEQAVTKEDLRELLNNQKLQTHESKFDDSGRNSNLDRAKELLKEIKLHAKEKKDSFVIDRKAFLHIQNQIDGL